MCAQVFRNLRHMWGINDAEYMLSLGGSSALRQLNSPGKSGAYIVLPGMGTTSYITPLH